MGRYLDLEGLGYLCGKIKADLDGKQNRMAGQPGQLVGFCKNGVSAINVTAGESVKLAQSDSGLEIGVDMDNGTVTGYASLLDDIIKPGTYTWADTTGAMGTTGGLWNLVVSRSDYEAVHPSVVQTLLGTYSSGTKGRVLARAFYYANNPNWTPWRELASLNQITNFNLLDNWYFLDPINQRGQIEYTTSGYTIDRWKMTGAGSVKVQDGGMLIQKATGAPNITFEIYIEDFRVPASETVTISAIVDGTLITATGTIEVGIKASGSTSDIWDRIEVFGVNSVPEVHIIRFIIVSEEPHLLKAAKLELGSAQTLVHQDASGNWALNDPPPDRTLEWLKCRRYFKSIGGANTHFTGYRDASNSKNIVCKIPDVPMRATPTVIANLNPIGNIGVKEDIVYPLDSADSFDNKIFFLHPTVEIPTRGVMALHINGTIWLSADL